MNKFLTLPIADKKENFRQTRVGIQEKEGEGLNMGICPLFELEVPGEEITVCPDRKAVCKEMTKFMRLRILGRNVQKRGGEILEKVFLKPNAPKDGSSIRMPGQWPDMVEMTQFIDGKLKHSKRKAAASGGKQPNIKRRKIEFDVTPRYGGGGRISEEIFDSLNLHPEARQEAASLANKSLATSTWTSYGTALNSVKKCEDEWGIPLSEVEWTEEHCINFITWCRKSGTKSTTCRQYLSGIKKFHDTKGWPTLWGQSKKVAMVLKGFDHTTEDLKRVRVEMSPEKLWILKTEIAKRPGTTRDRRMLWFVATIMTKASLRASEIMGDVVSAVKKEKVLLWRDIEKKEEWIEGEKVESIVVKVKAPKEMKNLTSVKVQLWRSEDFLDPVSAWEKYAKAVGEGVSEETPVAVWASGDMLTKSRFNKELRAMLEKHFPYEQGSISSHSFRPAIISLMAQLGCTESQMKDQGRWSSGAYNLYIKSGKGQSRKKQLEMSRRIEEAIADKLARRT